MFIGSKKEPEENLVEISSSCDFSGQEENVGGSSKRSYTFEGAQSEEAESEAEAERLKQSRPAPIKV